jgi:hypothetical protein
MQQAVSAETNDMHQPLPYRYVNGVHYSRTLEAWLQKHDAQRRRVLPVLEQAYGGKAEGWTW